MTCAENHKIYFLSSSEFPTYFRYVGRTKKKLSYRLQDHIKSSTRAKTHKSYWVKQQLQLGNKIIITCIQEGLESKECSIKEANYIKLLPELGYKLTNGTAGGEEVNSLSEAHKLYLSNLYKGTEGFFKGQKHTEESKLKMSLAQKGRAKPKEVLERLIKVNKKPINQLSFDKNFIKKFDSIKEAADELGLKASGISMQLHGKISQTGGFKFEFAI
jgi:Uri superfamily endonuclease